MVLPVLIFNEIGEGFFHHLQPLRRFGQAVQAHKSKSRFAIVINDAEFGFQRQIVAIQYVNKLAAERILHKGDAGRQLRHQRQILPVSGRFGVFHQRQDTYRVTAELDLIPHVAEKRRLAAIVQRPYFNQRVNQVRNRAVYRLTNRRLTGRFPALNQRIGGAGVAQRVIGSDRAVETGKPAVMVEAVLLYLTGQIIGAFFNHLGEALVLPVFPDNAIAGTSPALLHHFCPKTIAEDPLRFKAPERLLRILRPAKRLFKPPPGVVFQIDAIRRHDAVIAIVEQRVAGNFLLEHCAIKLRVKREAKAKIVTLGDHEFFIEGLPAELFHAVHDVNPQPLRFAVLFFTPLLQRPGPRQPREIEAGTARNMHMRA